MRYETDDVTWLSVPYSRKGQAKSLGARFDGLTKKWYIPRHVSMVPFMQAGFLGCVSRTAAKVGITPQHET